MKKMNIIINLPTYEPAGRDVCLGENELLQHVLIIGATGCGKTTLLRRMVSQLIARPATGLLIYDAKGDETVQYVTRLAAQQQRDVVVLGPAGTHSINLFETLRGVADIDLMTKRLLIGTHEMGRENAFWNEMRVAILDAALTMAVVGEIPVSFDRALNLMSEFFFRPLPREIVTRHLDIIQHLLTGCLPPIRRKLQQTLNTVETWRTMDSRIRSIVQATLVNVLRPLVGIAAANCFESSGRQSFELRNLASNGGICVASVNATREPGLANLFFKLVKHDFLNAIQERQDASGVLCGIVADELPLVLAAEDVEALATVRSRRCFVCAATQGIAIIDEKLGVRNRKALLGNFGSVIYMRGREEEVDLMAAIQLGVSRRVGRSVATHDEGTVLSHETKREVWQSLVCPPGTLGRLAPHQGFVVLPNNTSCEYPLSFVPYFEEQPVEVSPLPMFVPPQQVDPANSKRLERQLLEQNYKLQLDESELQSVLQLFAKIDDKEKSLTVARDFFRERAVLIPSGLEYLPLPWLRGLPGILWSLRLRHWTRLPYMISEAFVVDGLMQFRFAQEAMRDTDDHHVSAFDLVRQAVNIRLYPSRFCMLKRRDVGRLKRSLPTSPFELS